MRVAPVRPLLAASLGLAWSALSPQAHAVGIAGANPPPAVREEVFLVVFDSAASHEHILYAARLEPAAASFAIALPTAAVPDVEVLGAVDLPLALHRPTARYELSVLGREAARPAPWSVRGVGLLASGVALAEAPPAELPFDRDWMRSYAAQDGALALLSVTAPQDGRLELSIPAVRISFPAAQPVVMLREPPSPLPQDRPAETAGEPAVEAAGPYTVEDIAARPAGAAPTAVTIAKILRARTAPFAGCYERFLDRSPGAAATIGIEVTIAPRGGIAAAQSTKSDGGDGELASCVVAAVRKKQFPRMDAGWRFTANVRFVPPRTPARVTHVAVVAAERWLWPSPPAQVKRVGEMELRADEWASVFAPYVREAFGSGRPGRLWLSHYVDRSERRAGAADVRLVRSDIPREGQPGTVAYAEEKRRIRTEGAGKAAAQEGTGAALGGEQAPGPGRSLWGSRRRRGAIVAMLAALGAIALALGLDRAR